MTDENKQTLPQTEDATGVPPPAPGSDSVVCQNCGASVPANKAGTDPKGRTICCPACLFNPLGCRCKYGQLGECETQQWGDDDDDEDYYDDNRWCHYCGGEGWMAGDDLDDLDDPLWYDPGEIYTCPCCNGSGNAKDCTFW